MGSFVIIFSIFLTGLHQKKQQEETEGQDFIEQYHI